MRTGTRCRRGVMLAGRRGAAVAAIVGMVCGPGLVWADVRSVTQTGGPPELPIPMFQETGLPDFTMPVGTPSLPPAPNPNDPGAGAGEPGGGGAGGGGTTADAVLQQRSWGALAAQNVTAMGVNPSVDRGGLRDREWMSKCKRAFG